MAGLDMVDYLNQCSLNSLAAGTFKLIFTGVIFDIDLMIATFRSYDNALR